MKYDVSFSERFRTPLSFEKELGLWVDRIGRACNRYDEKKPVSLRILGLHAVVYIEQGTGSFITRTNGEMQVQAGDVLLLFPGEPHAYYPDRSWTSVWIVWGGAEADLIARSFFSRHDKPVIRDRMNTVTAAYQALAKLIGCEDSAFIIKRKSILLAMMSELGSTNQTGSYNTSAIMEKAVELFDSPRQPVITVEEIAKRSGMSLTHFRRLFKKYTGRSPKDYILSRRLSRAKEFLSGGKSIQETAEILGYDDVYYFMRIFKRINGLAPGRYLKQESSRRDPRNSTQGFQQL